MVNSIYIHIPFCSSICSYCDFSKFYYNKKIVDNYIEALLEEIKLNYKNDEINTIYIGGGTPSCLSIPQLEKMFSFYNSLTINGNIEYTIECNIVDITEEKLKLFRRNHVNRISIGVQSFQKEILKYLERSISTQEIIDKINLTKKYFNNINIDLMYAIPFETIDMLKNDLALFLDLNVPHISTYSLIIENNTKLGIDKTQAIDDELDRSMYDLISATLDKKGYIHYETSNFCYPGYQSKHNLTYWNNNKYYGFGLSAGGFVDNVRYTNTKNLNKYLSGNYIGTRQLIDKKMDASNYAILSLRTKYGINKDRFLKLYGIDFIEWFKVQDLLDEKVLVDIGDNYIINYKYWYISNEILTRFV